MLVPVPRRGPGLNSLLFYRKGGIAEAVTDEAGKGTLQKAQERHDMYPEFWTHKKLN